MSANLLQRVGAYGYFFRDCVVSTWRHGVRWDRVMAEAHKLGVGAFPVLATMAIFVGTNLAIQGHAAFSEAWYETHFPGQKPSPSRDETINDFT